jgi:hypothetical protein
MTDRVSVLALGLAACGATTNPPPVANSSRAPVDDRCEMIEAAFRLDAFRNFACGNAATKDHRILVDVEMVPRFKPTESCPSAVFAIYRNGEPTNTDAVLRMSLGSRDGQTWEFAAVYFDPPNSPDDKPSADGGWDEADYYCAFANGRLARTPEGWRAWVVPLR